MHKHKYLKVPVVLGGLGCLNYFLKSCFFHLSALLASQLVQIPGTCCSEGKKIFQHMITLILRLIDSYGSDSYQSCNTIRIVSKFILQHSNDPKHVVNYLHQQENQSAGLHEERGEELWQVLQDPWNNLTGKVPTKIVSRITGAPNT